MKPSSRSSRKTSIRPQSTAAKKSASRHQASRRRRAQRKRQIAGRWHQISAALQIPLRQLPAVEWQRPELRRLHGTGFQPSKLLSLLLLALVLGVSNWFMRDERFFIYRATVEFNGLTYLNDQELYQLCDLEGWSVFWIRPDEVRRRILTHPYTAAAQVQVQLPNRVTIGIDEMMPVAVWMSGDGTERWLLPNGVALPARGTAPNHLPRIIDWAREATVLGKEAGSAIQPDILEATLSLASKVPELNSVRYDKGPGLNFGLPGTSYWVYWGDGQHFETKFRNLGLLELRLRSEGRQEEVIDVRSPIRPIVRGS
jgi:cell division septal protein FtsQ